MTCNKKYHIVYRTVNLINGKFYYGVHSTNDLRDGYLGSGKILKRAVSKYGKDNFDTEVIRHFDDRHSAVMFERALVSAKEVMDGECYNLRVGGYGAGIENPFYGRVHTDETKRKMSKFQRGKNISDVTKKRLSDFWKNNPERLTQMKLKTSESNLGNLHTEDTKRKIRESNRKIIHPLSKSCFINGILYDSISQAAREYNVSNKTVTNRIHSRLPHWSAWGACK